MTRLELQFLKGLKISRETIERNQLLLMTLQNDVRILVCEYYDKDFQKIDQNDFEFQYSLLKAQMDIARLKIKICAREISINDMEVRES
jgi:hypothetical protein